VDAAKLAVLLFFRFFCQIAHFWNQFWPNNEDENGRKEYLLHWCVVLAAGQLGD
jgi:hypothetical protein